MSTQDSAGMEITVKFFPLAFILLLCKPRIEIDGRVYKRYWGTHFFELTPGTHTIKVYFWYFFMSRCGENSITVNVRPGEIIQVQYYMPPWMLAKGKITVY